MSGGGNWEFQWYTNNRSNSFVRDGILYIRPTLTMDLLGEENMKKGAHVNLCAGSGGNYINPIQSACLRTIDSMTLKYGKVEVRARLPAGDWLWPAIWMMPKYSSYGSWPASGEIDIIESRGNRKFAYGNASTVESTLHWGPSPELNRYNLTHAMAVLLDNTSFADDFHTYGLEWSKEGLQTYVDGKALLFVDFDQSSWDRGHFPKWSMNPWEGGDISAPFDQEFYLILNVAVGGVNGFWKDSPEKPWRNDDPHAVNAFWDSKDSWLPTWGNDNKHAMAIDWVKMWSAETNC
ncbi:hypothetical protein DFQ30_002561 [Apophysomyces sp. BC1015]|nr:hypothetical protein DFQ30_002561 [Apophysomyces sp. BC1015]KAG0176009.1 hypothetical protein DFQ29_006686 [Apophysomyces sp. BC1021]